MGIIDNIKKRGLKDILNPKKWMAYIKGMFISIRGLTLKEEEVFSYSEQLVYRSIKCKECFEKGACIDCSCPQPLAASVSTSQCSLGRYGPMLDSENWKKFKEENNINLKLR